MSGQDLSARLAALRAEPSRDVAGDPARMARVERTRTEMLAQGEAIRATLDGAAADVAALVASVASRPLDRIVVAGCGDSWHVGAAVRHGAEGLTGWPVEAAQALDYAAYGAAAAGPGTLVLGISAGGNTPAVMAALAAARARGAFAVGLSNTEGSPVLTGFDAGLVIRASRKGWPTQSSTAAMALILALCAALATSRGCAGALSPAEVEGRLATLPGLVDEVVRACEPEMREAAARFATAGLLLFAGLGPNGAAAAIGAAKVRELAPIHAIAQPLEEMHHYRAQKAGDPLVLVATDPAARERALDTVLVSEAVGGRTLVLLAGPDPEIEARAELAVRLPAVPAWLCGLVACLPLHVFAYHLARARDAAGLGYPGAWPPP